MQGKKHGDGRDSQALISFPFCLAHSLEPEEAGAGRAELGEGRRLELGKGLYPWVGEQVVGPVECLRLMVQARQSWSHPSPPLSPSAAICKGEFQPEECLGLSQVGYGV